MLANNCYGREMILVLSAMIAYGENYEYNYVSIHFANAESRGIPLNEYCWVEKQNRVV